MPTIVTKKSPPRMMISRPRWPGQPLLGELDGGASALAGWAHDAFKRDHQGGTLADARSVIPN